MYRNFNILKFYLDTFGLQMTLSWSCTPRYMYMYESVILAINHTWLITKLSWIHAHGQAGQTLVKHWKTKIHLSNLNRLLNHKSFTLPSNYSTVLVLHWNFTWRLRNNYKEICSNRIIAFGLLIWMVNLNHCKVWQNVTSKGQWCIEISIF